MNFQSSVDYLLSLGNEVSAMKLGLQNIQKLLAALGDPQRNYLKVQVAGTNGKGSVCAFLNSICLAAGVRTGMFTSPHLISMTERVQIDGREISEEKFAELASLVRKTSESLVEAGKLESVPTYFEQVTGIALLAFARAKVELAILETGLGGRLDATTAAIAEIAAITRIDYDHQIYLGETLEQIAGEKAAIIHHGSKVVIGEQAPQAMEVLLERCREVGVEPRLTSEVIAREAPHPPATIGYGIVGIQWTKNFPSITLALPNGGRRSIGIGLHGSHQIENARIAILIAEVLTSNFRISDMHIAGGLSRVHHPGRLEGIGRYLLDGAHNPGGAKALRKYLDESVNAPITMIYGSMNDKASNEILSILVPKVERLILTRAQNSRSRPPEELRDELPKSFNRAHVTLADDVAEGLQKARVISGPRNMILITGSLYLVGEARQLLTGGSETEM